MGSEAPTWPFALAAMLAGAAGLVRLTERAPAPVLPAPAHTASAGGAGGGQWGNSPGVGVEERRGARVTPDWERALIVGAMNPELVYAVLLRNRQQLRYCYENALIHAPGLAGTVIIAFQIGPDGNVTASEHVQSTLPEAGRDLELCLAARPRHWRFPAPRDGRPVSVTYPLVLTPAEG